MTMAADQFKKLLEDVSSSLKESLKLRNQDLDDDQIVELCSVVAKNSNIKKMDLSSNKIGDKGAKALAQLKLDDLDVSSNQIGEGGAEALSKAEIVSLDLSANEIGPKGAAFFAVSNHIKKLSLQECEIEDEGARKVLQNKSIEVLDLSTNNLTDNAFAKMTAEGSCLVELNLSQNEITSRGVEAILRCENLNRLNLSSNYLGDEGAELFSDASLTHLDLTQNNITKEGFLNLCRNKSIQVLRLYGNQISFKEDDSISIETPLVRLNLGRNKLDDSAKRVFEKLATIPTLEELNLSANRIKDGGAQVLYQFQSKSKSASLRIELEGNPIEDEYLILKAAATSSSR